MVLIFEYISFKEKEIDPFYYKKHNSSLLKISVMILAALKENVFWSG